MQKLNQINIDRLRPYDKIKSRGHQLMTLEGKKEWHSWLKCEAEERGLSAASLIELALFKYCATEERPMPARNQFSKTLLTLNH